ncbi:Survival protein SurA precursor (Peptidyl-prolyl cis-trans isomerase SurA) [hydrothermal vent metagenome]|uniref:Survival protein SurA (Peptidyl-prolyl cis-trans isomerase SurA) n=1 Tax=hydrothermal vent metagenome TaxID=652676 RepID=A0A3B0RJX7_9ZZZZ
MTMQRIYIFLIALTILAQATPSATQVSEGVAVVVNDKIVSTFDVRQRMRLMILSTQVQPTEESLKRFQAQAIRALIDEGLKIQETSKFDIEVSDEQVNQQIERLARQNEVTAASIKNDLIKSDISPRTLEDQIRADIAWQILMDGRYGSRVRVSNNQIKIEKQRFEANLAKPQYLISEIMLESPSIKQDPAIYAGAVSLIKQMQEGAPFGAVAQQFSAAPSGPQGGDVGWVRQGDMPTEVDSILANMKPGTISPPIKVAGGYYIVAMRDSKKGGAPEMVNFRQIIVPVASVGQLNTFLNTVSNCSDADGITDAISGSFVNPFDNVALADLSPAFGQILESLSNGQWSQPVETPNGAVAVMLCSKGYAEGSGVPSSDDIVRRITDQKLGMISRRYLRDLRRDSTIEIRQ